MGGVCLPFPRLSFIPLGTAGGLPCPEPARLVSNSPFVYFMFLVLDISKFGCVIFSVDIDIQLIFVY